MKSKITSMNDMYFNWGYYYTLKRIAAKKKAFRLQKIFGAMMIGFAVLSAIIVKDATLALLLAPAGVYIAFTKKLYLNY